MSFLCHVAFQRIIFRMRCFYYFRSGVDSLDFFGCQSCVYDVCVFVEKKLFDEQVIYIFLFRTCQSNIDGVTPCNRMKNSMNSTFKYCTWKFNNVLSRFNNIFFYIDFEYQYYSELMESFSINRLVSNSTNFWNSISFVREFEWNIILLGFSKKYKDAITVYSPYNQCGF